MNELAADTLAGTVGACVWSMWKGRRGLPLPLELLGARCALAIPGFR